MSPTVFITDFITDFILKVRLPMISIWYIYIQMDTYSKLNVLKECEVP